MLNNYRWLVATLLDNTGLEVYKKHNWDLYVYLVPCYFANLFISSNKFFGWFFVMSYVWKHDICE